jgi:hypothetical protein
MRHASGIFSVAFVLAATFLASAEVERKPLILGTKIETGQIVNGDTNSTGVDADKWYLSQIGVSLTQEVTVDKRLDMRVGVGGVFYYSFPIVPGNSGSQGTKFGPGITQAQAIYRFGDPENPTAILKAGYFPYKYNPDAKNLGEYLFRSMPYPTVVTTGGWAITDNAFVRAQGIQLSFSNFNGMLKNDFLLLTERDFRPQGDFTPSYVAELNVGPFQIGGGISLHHYLPIDGDRLETRDIGPNGTVVQIDNFPAFTSTVDANGIPYPNGPVVHEEGAPLIVQLGELRYILEQSGATFASDSARLAASALQRDTVSYTFKGIKLMARGSFNVQKIFPVKFLNPEDLKIYAEAAMLGVENQPGYFNKRWQRVPLMMGINLPTFKLLDVLSLEVEYFASSLPDEYFDVLDKTRISYLDYGLLARDPKRDNHKDDWKWSVYAKREIVTGLSIRAQVANDHFRTIDQVSSTANGVSSLQKPENWYYIISLNFGI